MHYVGAPSEVREQARRWVNAVRAAEVEPKVPLLGFGYFDLKKVLRAVAIKFGGKSSITPTRR